MSVCITRDEIDTYGEIARKTVPTITQNCGEIIDVFEGLLNDECGLPWDSEYADRYYRSQVRVGPNREEKHYIFIIDSGLVEGFESGGEVWIDLSFDQFNTSNYNAGIVTVEYGSREQLDKIRIIGPSHPYQTGSGPYQFGIDL